MIAAEFAAHRPEAAVAARHWLCNGNQSQASVLLAGFDGNERAAAQAVQVLGWGVIGALVDGGRLEPLTHMLGASLRIDVLNSGTASPAEKAAALSELRTAAVAYHQGVGTLNATGAAHASEQSTASVGSPGQFPPQLNPGAPELSPLQVFTFRREVLYKTLGGQTERAVNRRLVQPWLDYVQTPTVQVASELVGRLARTPVGEYFNAQAAKATQALDSVVGKNTPIGQAIKIFDESVIQNEKLWETVNAVNQNAQKVAAGALVTTAFLVSKAAYNGTLVTGTFNTSGKLSPDQKQMLLGVNIPPNMDVQYFTVPTTIPVNVRGNVHQVKTFATILFAKGTNVLFKPALPGEAGAQVWAGPVQDGGLTRQEKQIVSASSSVAAGGWGLGGFTIGTENFNIGGRVDLQAFRGLLNIFALQMRRTPPPPEQARTTLQQIWVFDLWSTFHSATFNLGPLAIVVDRNRWPQNDRLTIPNGNNTLTLAKDPRNSSVQPAFPLTGASTFKPTGSDMGLLLDLFSVPANPPQLKPGNGK